MNEREIREEALRVATRNNDGSIAPHVFEEALADRIRADLNVEEAIIRKEARLIMWRAQQPGVTPAHGSIKFAGDEPYPWEPDRLIAGVDGNLIEQRNATPPHMQASRTRENAKLEKLQAELEELEAEAEWEHHLDDAFQAWAGAALAGDDDADIVFDRFIREAGIRKPGSPESGTHPRPA